MLEVKDLRASVGDKVVLDNVSLSVGAGEVSVLIGPNGSGKSSLARVIMGDPRYEVLSGAVLLGGEDITGLSPDERAKKGIFLAFQSPPEIEGVTLTTFLLRASGRERDVRAFSELMALASRLGLDPTYLSRPVNKGFSGGERKRSELIQAIFLDRKYLLLDEIDSGVDIDGLDMIARVINDLRASGKGILLISHNPALLERITVDKVYVMRGGRIVRSGGKDILTRILSEGFNDR